MIKPNTPPLVVIMGVSGCGKSSLATRLAKHFDYRFLEADDFHCEQAKKRIQQNLPLTEEIRESWINRITVFLCQNLQPPTVLAYPGLRREHRQRLRELGYHSIFILLHGDKDLISQRMNSRDGHVLPSSVLTSQFSALQLPENEPDIFTLDLQQSPETLTTTSIALLNQAFAL
ncbi:gluconokinase [Paraglaciecola polaris]|uniref:Gluconokinase n=1 Tax=Paraglaciecola polaris LMG 21857 TaxID=1129793 RepID=K7AIB6_9ALTE|nr:gluconokinase, GntK/IdnK-type [Paraglaciecola polaris]GAC35000.1 gluconokinase [Paraglaciecola polaris LMG 21857]|tara:strand:- start:4558 stop:5079 length:522 start_codon:yes stop_codon:yes gene_type:complete